MTPHFFGGSQWGFIDARHIPIIRVHSIRFVYPEPFDSIWEIPQDWIRMDRKYGHIRLVPGSKAFAAPLQSWVMQTLAGGRDIPHMIQVRYQVGLQDVRTEHPDLFDLIMRMAVLKIVEDQFLPQSGSISADGLSDSISVDTKNYRESVNDGLQRIKDHLHGIRGMAW